jgi:hypothetical protein
MALNVERVVNGGMNGPEALGRSGRLEPLHLTLAPSCRLMEILGPISCATPLMARRQPYFGLNPRGTASNPETGGLCDI